MIIPGLSKDKILEELLYDRQFVAKEALEDEMDENGTNRYRENKYSCL